MVAVDPALGGVIGRRTAQPRRLAIVEILPEAHVVDLEVEREDLRVGLAPAVGRELEPQ